MDMAAAAEVGVRDRTKEPRVVEEDEAMRRTVTETPAAKRRKLQEEVDGESRIIYSPCVQVQLTNRGGIVARDSAEPPETSVVGRTSSAGDQCQSPSSEDNLRGASISCCSSNGFSEKVKGRIEFLDLEEEENVAETGTWRHNSCSTSKSATSPGMDSGAEEVQLQASECCGGWRAGKGQMTVTEAEVEEFFMEAEKDLRKKIFECSRKYNFDFVKEEALDGRYEWVKLN